LKLNDTNQLMVNATDVNIWFVSIDTVKKNTEALVGNSKRLV
jgi:hypothetical protein